MKTPRAKCKRKKKQQSMRVISIRFGGTKTIQYKNPRKNKERAQRILFAWWRWWCFLLLAWKFLFSFDERFIEAFHSSKLYFFRFVSSKKKQSSKMLVCSVDDAEKLPEKKNEIIEEWKQKTKTFSFQNKAKNSKRTKKIIRNYQEWL